MTSDAAFVPLADAILLQRGFDLPAYERQPGEVPVVASRGIVGHHSIAKAAPPGVVIGRSGSVGGGQFITVPYWPLNTTLWVKDFRGHCPRFVYYLLRSIDFTRLNAGSGVPTLNRNHLRGTLVWLPSRREQERVAALLGTLDDKIESNRRLAALLDGTASNLFRARFLDFVGVEEFDHSEAGRIPRGWHVKKVSDLCATQYGYTATASEKPMGPKFLRVKDINKRPWIEWSKTPYCEASDDQLAKYRLRRGDILVARMADPGKVAICDDVPEEAVFASYLVRLATRDLASAYFLYGFLSSHLYQDAYVSTAVGGSVQKNMNAKVIVAATLVVPPDDEIESFAALVGPLRERLAAAVCEAATLSHVREALLPKLISGAIRVPDASDAEEVVGPVADEVRARS